MTKSEKLRIGPHLVGRCDRSCWAKDVLMTSYFFRRLSGGFLSILLRRVTEVPGLLSTCLAISRAVSSKPLSRKIRRTRVERKNVLIGKGASSGGWLLVRAGEGRRECRRSKNENALPRRLPSDSSARSTLVARRIAPATSGSGRYYQT